MTFQTWSRKCSHCGKREPVQYNLYGKDYCKYCLYGALAEINPQFVKDMED